MMSFTLNQNEYLERINYKGSTSEDFESLKSIRLAQHRSIPFENFDICLGKGISLEPDVLVEKLIKNKRGGYCFELNGLLLLALKSFGFQTQELLGRVHLAGEPTGRSHYVILVTIGDEKWLVDAGFGAETPLIPIPLVCNQTVSFEGQSYRLIESELYGFMLQKQYDTEWKNLYSVDLNHVCPGDIDYGNYYTSTSPKSIFVQGRIATIPVENGKKTLFNMQFKKVIDGKEEIIDLEEGESYLNILEKEFGIALGVKYKDLKPLQ
ncbi:arylamine N-acetyltransferase [Limibacter armeniacum]|uniref:arylamine N-acetyltransferase family protein n=1 Tax=Limibacter armeniacum TaxID=466084 RepID=UPI002FE5C572